MQQVSGVRGQHLDKSDRKSLCLAEWIQRGQQRNPSTGTRLRTGASLAGVDVRRHWIRSGGKFHRGQGAALRGRASLLVQDGRDSDVIHSYGSHKKNKNPTAGHVNIPIYLYVTDRRGTALSSSDACLTPKTAPKQKEVLR